MSRLLLSLPLVILTGACDDIVNARKPEVSGTVLIGGATARGIVVTLVASSQSYQRVTDAAGQFAFEQVRRGSGTLSVTPPDGIAFKNQSIDVIVNDSSEVYLFEGFRPVEVSGSVVWEHTIGGGLGEFGLPGIVIRMLGTPFPVPDVVTSASGFYRFARAPGFGRYEVSLGTLPGGLVYTTDSSSFFFDNETFVNGHVSRATYKPKAFLRVVLTVDGQPFTDAKVHLATPLPVIQRADRSSFNNLPVMPLAVSITDFPATIQFDSTTKTVQLRANAVDIVVLDTVIFTGRTRPANRPPVPTISAPANGASFGLGSAIAFAGQGIDPEDGALSGTALRWTSSVQGVLGTGATISRNDLTAGAHRIVLRATDQAGASDSAFVNITVLAVSPGRLTGTVTLYGVSPIAGVRINLSTTPAQSVFTNGQGIYTFESVLPGTYNVTAVPPAFVAFTPATQSVTIGAGQTVTANFNGTTVAPTAPRRSAKGGK